MDNLARASARRILDQEAPAYARDLLAKDGLEVPANATGRDVLMARLRVLAEHNQEAARLARELEGRDPL
ncbi:MAG: hypothetical protein IKB65_09460 [Ruminiclostridium sp.]|nr:hypothetical protein [Ruminiclostridium sp.]